MLLIKTFVRQWWRWLILLALILALGLAWLLGAFNASGEIKYKTAQLDQGSITASVSAGGTINPVSSVQVGSQVSGQIKEVRADFNTEVKTGQILARIDPEIFEFRVRQAQADVDSARAQQWVAQSNLAARRADLSRAELNLLEFKNDAARKQSLFERQFISNAERDKSISVVKLQDEDLKTAKAQIDVAQAQVKSAESSTQQRIAALDSAKADLARTIIKSPVDGIVIKRSIENGATVAASLQAPELFVIAKNLRDMQVDTAIDESDISKIKLGMKTTFSVDSFPGRSFTGEVVQVRKAAQTVQNVVTYTVVVGFANNDGALLPGMTANVRLITADRADVLRLPAAALRFKPANAGKDDKLANAVTGSGQASATVASNSGNGGNSGGAQAANRAFRERLSKELALTQTQNKQVEDVYLAMRERFMAVRDLPEEVRAKAGQNLRAEIRDKIAALLTAEQKPKYDAIVADMATHRPSAGAGGGGRGKVYIIGADGKPVAVDVRTGVSDGSLIEIISPPDSLKVGVEVVVGTQNTANSKPSAPTRSPF